MPIIRRNLRKNGIEVVYPGEAPDADKEWLYTHGYKKSTLFKNFWIPYTEKRMEQTEAYFGGNAEIADSGMSPAPVATPPRKTARINVNDPHSRVNKAVLRSEWQDGKLFAAMHSYFDGMTDSTVFIKDEDLKWIDEIINKNVLYAINSDYRKAYVSSAGMITKDDYYFKYKPDILLPEYIKPKSVPKADFYVNMELTVEKDNYEVTPDESGSEEHQEGEKVETTAHGRKVCGTIIKKEYSHYTIQAWGQAPEKHTSVSYMIRLNNGHVISGYQFRKSDTCTDLEPIAIYFPGRKSFEMPDWIWSEVQQAIKYHKHSLLSADRRKKAENKQSDLKSAAAWKKKAFELMGYYLGWELDNTEFSREHITGESEPEQQSRIKGWQEDLEIKPIKADLPEHIKKGLDNSQPSESTLQSALTYDEFVKQYRENFQQAGKYTPNQVGSEIFIEKMAKLADQYPDFLERFEKEEEARHSGKMVEPVLLTPGAGKPGTIRPGFIGMGTLLGREIQISMPNLEKRHSQFAIVELKNIIASHNEENFHSEPEYPKNAAGSNINDRNYKDDLAAQKAVMDYAKDLEPERLITTSRTPSGTPIITTDGFVVSGNNRTMSLKLAAARYPDNFTRYTDFLSEEIEAYGFDSSISTALQMGQKIPLVGSSFNDTKTHRFYLPVLVRIDYDFPEYTTQELAKYNKDTKKSERPVDKAIKLSNILRENSRCADIIAEITGRFETFSEFYANIVEQKKLSRTLVECNLLTDQELPAYFNGTTFTEAGKEFIENLLAALILDRDALVATEQPGVKATRQKLITSLPVLMKNASLPEGSLKKYINDAVVLQQVIKASGSEFADFIRQQNLYKETYDRKAVYLNRLIDAGKLKFKQGIEGYNDAIVQNQGQSLFGDKPSTEQVFDHWIKGNVSETDQRLIEASNIVTENQKNVPEIKENVPIKESFEASGHKYPSGETFPLQTDGIRKEFLRFTDDQDPERRFKILLVDGEAVRKDHIEFTMGGHGYVYDYVPKDEIWIDENLKPKPADMEATIVHEIFEVRQMRDNKTDYEGTHELANNMESFVRNQVDQKIFSTQELRDLYSFEKGFNMSYLELDNIASGTVKTFYKISKLRGTYPDYERDPKYKGHIMDDYKWYVKVAELEFKETTDPYVKEVIPILGKDGYFSSSGISGITNETDYKAIEGIRSFIPMVIEKDPSMNNIMKEREIIEVAYGLYQIAIANKNKIKLNPYIAMYKGKKQDIYADTKYHAQLQAAEFFNAKHSYEVDVYLAEEDEAPAPKENKIIDVFLPLIKKIKPFVSQMQLDGLARLYRSEEKEGAIEIATRIADIVSYTMPSSYETEGIKTPEKMVYLHYFNSSSDWYIVEKDKGSKNDETPGIQNQAFGYAILNGDRVNAEWGYISIEELRQNNVELDFFWTPKIFSEILPKEEKPERKQLSMTAPDPAPEPETIVTSSISRGDYKNDFELNKAIEALLDKKWNDNADSWSADELQFLTAYTGYGGLDQYGEITKGSLFEYFTPDQVIEKMWGLAYKYGYRDGPVLEPSVGTAPFFNRQYVSSLVEKTGYEINKYSARIAKLLYPEANINDGAEIKYFEQLFIAKNNITVRAKVTPKYRLVIGNPPYGTVGGIYMGMGEKSYTHANNYIDYFILRGLDLLETGGLLIFIVGAETAGGGVPFLDQNMNKVKEMINDRGKLIDAYRLPSGVFSRTDVTSDIIIFRKR